MQDIAQALTGSLARDGRGGMTGPLSMNGQKVTGLAAGTAPTDAATVAQIVDGPPGPPGKPNNTYTSYSAMQASDPTLAYAYLIGDTDNPPRPDSVYTNPTKQVGGWVPGGAAVNVAPTLLTGGGGLDYLTTQTISGVAASPARGNVHAYDVASIGSADVVPNPTFAGSPATGWTLSNFTSNNPGITHAAGSIGSAKRSVNVTPNTVYLIYVTITTTSPGDVTFYLDGRGEFNDDEGTALVNGTVTLQLPFLTGTSNGAVVFELRTADTAWAGTVTRFSLIQVEREAPYDFFSVASDNKSLANRFGIKFGRYLSGNVSIGDRSTGGLIYGTNGAWNTLIGSRAGSAIQENFENTAVGAQALEYNAVDRNTAGGYACFRYNTKGIENTGWGYKTFGRNSVGSRNTGIGFWGALYSKTGSDNTVVGARALYYSLTGNFNTALGSQAGINAGGDGNTYVGALTGPLRPGEFRYLYANQVCLGAEASAYGNSTTSLGRLSRCGVDPTQAGGYEITTTATAVGMSAIAAQDSTVAVGGNANASAIRTTAVGEKAQATGPNAVSLGFISEAREQGSSLGAQAGINMIGVGNTSIGYGANSFGGLMNRTNATALGFGATTSGDNEVTLGNSAVGKLRCAVTTITAISDRRDKKNIATIDGAFASAFIKTLDPVRWDWNMRGNVKREGGDVGFIAQDLWAAQEQHDAMWLDLVSNSDPERLEATPGRLIPVLAAALKSALARIEALEAK